MKRCDFDPRGQAQPEVGKDEHSDGYNEVLPKDRPGVISPDK